MNRCADPDCHQGWKSKIEVHGRYSDSHRSTIVEVRDYPAAVAADPDLHAEAWAVGAEQVAYEVVVRHAQCDPGWVHPDERRAEEELDEEARGTVRRRGSAFWDDDAPALGAGR